MGDGVDVGVRTNEQWANFVCWAVLRNPQPVPGRVDHEIDARVMQLIKDEFPFRLDRSKWPDQKLRAYQDIGQQRSYVRNGVLKFHPEGDGEKIMSRIDRKMANLGSEDAEEVPQSQAGSYVEGNMQRTLCNRYERDAKARKACLEHYGFRCVVCGSLLEEIYGELGREIIHVHHLKELSTLGPNYKIDPINDLMPICPNCHAIAHSRIPAIGLDEIKTTIAKIR